jgi:glycosyltransferase involved in cell wall biosynthesis
MPSYRLLVLTYHWPPFPGSGATRWTSLVKYLRRAGHEVTVITTSAFGTLPSDPDEGVLRTRDLAAAGRLRRLLRRPPLEAPGEDSRDVAKPASTTLTRVLVPDAYVASWVPFASRTARRYLRRHPVDCVITSSPPDSVHLAGLRLGAAPPAWIADLRDGWLFEPLKPPFPIGAQRRLDARLERQVAERADALTAATRPIAEDLKIRLEVEATLVPNAWDPDFEPEVQAAGAPRLPAGMFNFVHTGTLSGAWGRDPRPFMQALGALIAERPELAERVRLVLAGRLSEEDRWVLAESGIESIVQELGSVPRAQALALQRSGDTLVLVTSHNVGEATGKLFEYLAAGRPILALAAGNEAARIIGETSTGVAVDPRDATAVRAAVKDAVDRGLEAEYAPRSLDRYVYPGPAQTFAEVIEGAVELRRRHG